MISGSKSSPTACTMTAAPLDANLASYIKLGVALYLVGYLATVAYRIRL